MKRAKDSLLVILLCVCAHHQAHALQITGGKLIDVVVADSGQTDSTFHTYLAEGEWPVGPLYFDVDRRGDIYVVYTPRILRFSKAGKWISTFKGVSETGKWQGEGLGGLVVDNCGNTFVIKSGGIMKFSGQGEFLSESKDRKLWDRILADKDGRIYGPGTIDDGIEIYDQNLNLRQVIPKKRGDYIDIGIVQKEAGNDIYFRQDRCLYRTSLEEYSENRKLEKVAPLPKELTNPEFLTKKELEDSSVQTQSCWFIGFDKDSCFYFYNLNYFDYKERKDICRGYSIFKYCLRGGKLKKAGEIELDFTDYKVECSSTSLERESFDLSFLLTGDGTIYWLHGTVETVKVSKIIFDK